MGRAIESNYDAAMTVDCLQVALLKDHTIAARIGAELYDPVWKYTPTEADATSSEELLAFLEKGGHPVLKMDPMF